MTSDGQLIPCIQVRPTVLIPFPHNLTLAFPSKLYHFTTNHSPRNTTPKASIDTTITTLSHFILAMVQHPHVLRRAQAELDDVLGSVGDGLESSPGSAARRLPTFEDRAKLPYCDAVFTETLRWGVQLHASTIHHIVYPHYNPTTKASHTD